MKIRIEKDYEAMSRVTGGVLADYIRDNPDANICFPTGGSVDLAYGFMCERIKSDGLSMSGIKAFNMDEYATLSRTNENGYYYYLNKNIYSKTNIRTENTFAPRADADDLALACREYTRLVEEQGGVDFILLGIGSDGHIAFNMPSWELQLDTHIEDLTEETIEANSRFFEKREDVPRQALSIGVGMIMKSKKIVLVASGKGKADVLGVLFNNRKLDPMIPATVLTLHPDVSFILDEDAAGKIDRTNLENYI